MSHSRSSPSRPSRASRASPYPRPSVPAPAHRSPLSSDSHPPSSSSEDAASHHSENDVPPGSSHNTTTVILVKGHSPSPDSHPFYTLQPSSHLDNSADSFARQPTPLSRLLFGRNRYLPSDSVAVNLHSDSIISYPSHPVHNSQNPQDLDFAQPSIAFHRPSDSTDQGCSVHQPPPQIPQEQPSAFGSPRHLRYAHYQSPGMFSGSHNLSFSDNTFIDNSITSDNFMKEFLRHTIIGAEFDSSDRHPPPRCHPGTRLAIVERCKVFIVQCNGKEKMRWVVGPAGVGKSAIMQIVAEEILDDVVLGASVFLSVNGRQDGLKLFTTIAFQLAAKCEPYRQLIRQEIGRDPSLLRKSLPTQFHKFIVDPFILQHLFNPSDRFLIIIDGLDECDDPFTQQELLGLITDFCISYPTSPLVWLVASRPEPHITSFFDDERVSAAFTKEEIAIDSDEACQDVQRYLHNELNKVKLAYPTLRYKREWPSELDFTKIAMAAGGLFAYASTVARYIGDPHYRDPAARLRHVLETIDAVSKDDVLGRDHPMARLDALYARILSNIPADVMVNTRKLLLVNSPNNLYRGNFRFQCNRLGLTEDAAYGAVCHLHAVTKVPAPENADDENFEYFHKSFADFLFDFKRSGFCHNVEEEADRLLVQSSFRIVDQVPDDCDSKAGGEGIECYSCGYLKCRSGFCDNVSLSWPGDERFLITDDQLRLKLYRYAISSMCNMFSRWTQFDGRMSMFHVLTTRFTTFGSRYPVYQLRDSVFEQFRPELTKLGKLKRVPLRALDYSAICGKISLRYTSPIGRDVQHSNPWHPICEHIKEDVADLQQWRGWSTSFNRFIEDPRDELAHTGLPRFHIKAGKGWHWQSTGDKVRHGCSYCSQRLYRHFSSNLDEVATVFIDSTELCYVELSFVDPEDGVSEWRYRFLHSGPPSCIN